MKRYIITGNYSSDEVASETYENHNEISIPLLQEDILDAFGINHVLGILKNLNIYPNDRVYDLLVLALLVYLADTRISRELHAQDSWTREIYIKLPVKESDIWNNCISRINRMLRFLTGDIWSVSFTERTADINLEDGDRTNEYNAISLFSGGMDSLISTINLMEEDKNVLLAAHANESLVKKAQTDIIGRLDEEYPNTKHTLVDLWTRIPKGIIIEGGEENSTRSRSFLFIAFAVFVGVGTVNLKELIIPENGLIAINVPMDSMRVGAHSTRTTHPFYLEAWNDLLKEVGIDFFIHNHFWNITKGEMADGCLNRDLLFEVMPISMSCSSPGKERFHGITPQHCGYCLPCIIRRAAMYRAFNTDNTQYAISSVKEIVDDREHEKGVQMRSIQYAIERLKGDPEFADYAIMKPGPLKTDKDYLKELSGVYTRGLMEVDKWIQDSLEKENAN